MGFSRQEYWSGLPCPPPGDLPDPGIEPMSLTSLTLAGRVFTTGTTWEALLVFTAALLTAAKQPKCLWTDERIKKMWYIHTMEYHSVIMKSEIMSFAVAWMGLEIIILSTVRQISYDITYRWKKMIQMLLENKDS